MIENSITLTTVDYTLTFDKKSKKATYTEINTKVSTSFFGEEVKAGIIFFDLTSFNGLMFYHKNNLYDTIRKIIYFSDKNIFIGDTDKEAFRLYDKFEEIVEKIIKEGNEKKKSEFDDAKNKKIVDETFNKIKKELEKFDGKVKLINGKFGILEENDETNRGKKDKKFKEGKYVYIHENKLESFINNKKSYEGDFIQEEKDNSISILKHGKGKYFENNDIYEGEFFYNYRIGRGKMNNDKNEKFYFPNNFLWDSLNEISKKDGTILYSLYDKRITLEMKENDFTKPVRILVKDIENVNIKYEINIKMTYDYELKNTGIVRDFRSNEILIVNFSTNNIITNDLDNLVLFIDNNEFIINKKTNEEISPKNAIRGIFNNILNYECNIEILANQINKRIIEEKIKLLGIRDQGADLECWVYALSGIIYMTNSRIYGRKIIHFKQIYDSIIKKYSKKGKTYKEIEKIMDQELPEYTLDYSKINNDNEVKSQLQNGIQCLLTFYLDNKQWENFSDYFEKDSTNQSDKILTKEILDKPVTKKIDKPDDIGGHAVILKEIDDNDNYVIVNSWGKDWGDDGKFRVKKNCFENCSIYALHFRVNLLKDEDIENWSKFKNYIKEDLYEMQKSQVLKEFKFSCPKCKKSSIIKNFQALSSITLKCPFEQSCIFDAHNYDFIADQVLSYENKKLIVKKNKFDFEYKNEFNKTQE